MSQEDIQGYMELITLLGTKADVLTKMNKTSLNNNAIDRLLVFMNNKEEKNDDKSKAILLSQDLLFTDEDGKQRWRQCGCLVVNHDAIFNR